MHPMEEVERPEGGGLSPSTGSALAPFSRRELLIARSGYVTGRVHSVADADRQNVNARLVHKLGGRERREDVLIKQAEPPPREC